MLERYGLEANLIRSSQPDLENLYARIRRERGETAGLVSAFILTNAVFASFKDGRVWRPELFIAMSCCLINVAAVTRNQRMLLHAASLLSGEESVFATWQRADALANFHQKRLATDPVGEMKEVTRRFGFAHDAATRIISERLVSPFPALNNAISGTIFNFANTELRHARSTPGFDAIIERTTFELEADGKRLGQQRAEFTLGSGEMYSCELFIRHHNAGGFRRRGFTEHDPGLAHAEVDKVFEIHGFDHVPLYVRVSLLECRSRSMCLEGDLASFEENASLLKADLDLLGDMHRSERMRSVMEAQHRSLTQARHSKCLRSDTTLTGAVAAF